MNTLSNLQKPFYGFGMLGSLLALVLALGASPASAEEEASLYERLGGTYNIALTVDYLVDMIYINRGLNANPILAAIHGNERQQGRL